MRVTPRHRVLHREQVPIGAVESVLVKQETLERFPFRLHCHPELELTLILAGRGTRQIGDSVSAFGPGDLCLVGPGVQHSWRSQRGCGPCSAIVVQFPAALFASWAAAAEGAALDRLLRQAGHGIEIHSEPPAGLLSLPSVTNGPQRLAVLGGILAALASLPAQRRRVLSTRAVAADDPRWAAFDQHIAMHLADPLSQRAAARRLGMAPSSFARAFRRRYGTSFMHHLGRLRVRAACARIHAGEVGLADIADACGFSSLSSFNRWFRLVTGIAPGRYRWATS